ncbi:acyltransferase family protein [Pseudomonas poae]|uniref:acyltransferase family protein n=1 Tax=Pseudomonas poae TaxID=200451 RepID=UPI0003495BE6|nr:acyltransferase [Pseudomonas poae]
MEIIGVLFAFLAMLIALLSTYFISSRLSVSDNAHRFITIDGLRGYLAFFVFLHHSCIWFFYLKTGSWTNPPIRVFVNFGQVGVSLFFMITGFLFFSKLLDSRNSGVDWLRLYVSRFLRLVPLYFFSMGLLFLVVFIITRNNPPAELSEIILSISKWLFFTIQYGSPDINGLANTNLINASVAWSLPYEWTFYFALPLIFLAIGGKSSIKYLLLSALCMYGFGSLYFVNGLYWLFVGGMFAAIVVRLELFKAFSKSKRSSIIILLLLILVFIGFPSVYESSLAKMLLVAAFCLIAGGNSVFGLFKSKVSRTMGELAYSMYLLHGILLYVMFKLVFESTIISQISALKYCFFILALTPILVFICGLTFSLIERPTMKKVAVITDWLRGEKSTQVKL